MQTLPPCLLQNHIINSFKRKDHPSKLAPSKKSSDTPFTQTTARSGNSKLPKEKQEKVEELLITTIISANLPFAFVDIKNVRNLFAALNPQFDLCHRDKVKRMVLRDYDVWKSRLKTYFMDLPNKISVTFDI